MEILFSLPDQEFVHIVSYYFEGHLVKLNPDQNIISRAMGLDLKLTNPDELAVDYSSGTCPVYKSSLFLTKQRHLVGFDLYQACIEIFKKRPV